MATKGTTSFYDYQSGEIKKLLLQIRNSARPEQKELREKLRKKYNFYISDFTNSKKGFTPNDFDVLVSSGKINIIKSVIKIS